MNSLKKGYSKNSIKPVSNLNQELPPSSIQAFLRQNLSIAGVLVTDHEVDYTNKFFHSIFDTPKNLKIAFPADITETEAVKFTTDFSKRLKTLLTNIAQTIYYQAAGKDLQDQVDQTLLNRLVYCFYQNSTCDFFKGMLTDQEWLIYNSLLNSQLPKNKLS